MVNQYVEFNKDDAKQLMKEFVSELKNIHSEKIMFSDGKYLFLNTSKKWKKNVSCFYRNGPSILITKIKKIHKKNIYENGKIINFTMKKSKSIDINIRDDFIKLVKHF